MAAHSGGTDWNSVVKPLLTNRFGLLTKQENVNLIKAIIKNENEILDEDSNYIQFYTAFVALAADRLSQSRAASLAHVPQVYDACSILINFLLNRLPHCNQDEVLCLFPVLRNLCEVKQKTQTKVNQGSATAAGGGVASAASFTSNMLQFDYNAVVTALKSSKYPENNKTIVTVAEKESPKAETKRSRCDLSSIILQQLTAPLETGQISWTPLTEEPTDCMETFSSANIASFHALNGTDKVLDYCLTLPILTRYRLKYADSISSPATKSLFLPLTQVEASQIKSTFPFMAADISILWQALSLPLFDELNADRILKLSKCAMSALYCAVLTSIANSVLTMASSASSQKNQQLTSSVSGSAASKDIDEKEEQTRFIVDKALEIYTFVGNVFKNSSRTHIYQNHLCGGSWLLVSGIQGAMGASSSTVTAKQQAPPTTEDNAKSKVVVTRLAEPPTASTARVNLFKVQQGFGVLNAAIANHCIKVLTELIHDLNIESTSLDTVVNLSELPEPANFDILKNYTSLQRVIRVLNTATIHQLFTFLATVSYRKACALRRANAKDRTECEQISYSDSTTYFNDTMSCSDVSEEDDSDSYLGHWFKETLSPEVNEDASGTQAQDRTNEGPRSTLVSTCDEPHEYLELAAQIFCFLDKFYVNKHPYLHRYIKASLSDQQMLLLANILKDLDRDTARGETEAATCARWQVAMLHFSGAVGRYLHNLISANLLSETLQSNLLQHLQVSPWTTDSNHWPLTVYSSTLSVLVQILLLKPAQEKEAACLSVWHRLIHTIVEGVCSSTASDADFEDLNMEHAQLLLFLFHSLNLMQKKSVLLLTAGGVIRCAEVCRSISERPLRNSQIMLLSRLLLFLEYLMKHLYNAPAELLDQVRWNLFSISAMPENQKVSDLLNSKTKLTSFTRKDIEEKLGKIGAETISNIRPTFYSLTVIDSSAAKQEFKLDGLAWNFILCTPDKLRYPLLVDSLIEILSITDLCHEKLSSHMLCSIQYCFGICWKLLLGLPPSTTHFEAFMQNKVPNLHSLLWSIRCPSSNAHYLIVNSLIKQGMYTQYAESLWNDVSERVKDLRFALRRTLLGVDSFNQQHDNADSKLSQIILLDSLLASMYSVISAEKDGNKQISTNGTSSSTGGSTSGSTSPIMSCSHSPTITDQDVYSSSESIDQKSKNESVSSLSLEERILLMRELIVLLGKTYKILVESLKNKMLGLFSDATPQNILNMIIPILAAKNPVTAELNQTFMKLLAQQDRDVITTKWPKSFVVMYSIISAKSFPEEEYTSQVIDAHITELTADPQYSPLFSLMHCVLSIFNLLPHLLQQSNLGDDEQTAEIEKLWKPLLVAAVNDKRLDYLHDTSRNCLNTLLEGVSTSVSTVYVVAVFEHNLYYCYRIILELSEELRQSQLTSHRVIFNETMLFGVLNTLNQILDSANGLKAMHEFFKVKGTGSIVEFMLSLTGTTMPLSYAKKILQFLERLFHEAEKPDTEFPMDDLVQCFSELANVEGSRMKAWLSHVIYRPSNSQIGSEAVDKILGSIQRSSTPSSNAQTPTNMATVSAMPSFSDQLAHPSVIDVEEMEIDDDAAIAPADGQAGASLNLWPNAANNSYVTNHSEESTQEDTSERNGTILLNVVKYIVHHPKSLPGISLILFQSLLQLGQSLITPPHEVNDFADVVQIMITLADVSQGRGHATLFNAAIVWLEILNFQLLDRASNAKNLTSLMPPVTIENITSILHYLWELLQALGFKGSRALNPPWDDDMQPEVEELTEDTGADDDDSVVDDSDEDTLNSKLCTFSQTQKEFMNQHWYHCYTCNMVNTVGVCSVCARVCHKGHDVSYAKYGNFFCDCGAKEDGSCQALSRRVSASGNEGRQSDYSSFVNSSFLSGKKRTLIPPTHISSHNNCRSDVSPERIATLAKLLEQHRENLINVDHWSTIVRCILDFFDVLMPSIEDNCDRYSIVGCHKRARCALEQLHTGEQSFQITDQLMMPTLGSQEGAFENVRMNYSGDQGQTIKQLLSSGLVRRVALCCLSSPHGKRQHLAVSHEKGKVTILQLSALLKQADVAKRKLTLTQISSAPIPCTVLSLSANLANEDCLAVCGLKECHILTFNNHGATNEHIVLTPQLENGNFIKKAIWLPGSQTMLALVTADYVKIYELAEDAYSPKHYFLLAVGKIRDCTFVYQDGVYFMLIIASSGYIYHQKLDDQSLAKHGDFYVTNTLELSHPQIKDSNQQISGGGCSIYYSHTLQLLFFSYSSGRNFVAPLLDVNKGVESIQQLQVGSATKTASKGLPQALCQWTEISGHPGLICAMLHTSNNPVIFMFTPERIQMQEIKAQSNKARIMDMVAIRHTVAGVEKTTLILLCEDGSLRIFTANPETTSYWLSPRVQPFGNQLYTSSLLAKAPSSKKSKRKTTSTAKTAGTNGSPTFPIDFFEHCTMLQDVEFGGNDLLQIYNKQKLKSRLVSSGMFVASTKPSGFTLEVYNTDVNSAIVGIRVHLGTQDPLRAPQSVTVLGRTVPTICRRARWFDIPLTREEMLQSDKCLKVVFGRSQDPDNVSMLDSIEVYGKAKDLIGWPEEAEDTNNHGTTNSANPQSITTTATPCTQVMTMPNFGEGYVSITNLDRMLTHLLEVLDSALSLLGGSNVPQNIKQKAIKTTTNLILLPTPNQVQLQSRYVLATLFNNRSAYHLYKDGEIITFVYNELQLLKAKLHDRNSMKEIDPEAFYRLVLMLRGIATSRPQSLTKICLENEFEIFEELIVIVERLYEVTPRVDEPTSIVRTGLSHLETIVHCLVEIMYAFAYSEPSQIEKVTKHFINLLKNESTQVSHSAKEAIMLLLSPRIKRGRKVAIVTPPACSTPTPSNVANAAGPSTSGNAEVDAIGATAAAMAEEVLSTASAAAAASAGAGAFSSNAVERSGSSEYPDAPPIDALGPEAFEAYMGSDFPQLLALQHDTAADEEAIMDIAIALSLQQHESGTVMHSLQQGLANLQNMRTGNNSIPIEGSIATNASSVSAAGSDDEGSNVATDGSTLRTSPAEPVGSGGSESGGSGVESIGGISGRSSTYGDQANSSPPRSSTTAQSESQISVKSAPTTGNAAEDSNTAAIGSAIPTTTAAEPTVQTGTTNTEETNSFDENLAKLHELRIAILDTIVLNLESAFEDCDGCRVLPLMQVILTLTMDMNTEKDRVHIKNLVEAVIKYIGVTEIDEMVDIKDLPGMMNERTKRNEVHLVLLCLLSVLMGKTKKQTGTTSPPHLTNNIALTTAQLLNTHQGFRFILAVLNSLLPHWKRLSNEQVSIGPGVSSVLANTPTTSNGVTPTQNSVLKPVRYGPKPDISTLIPHSYLKNYPDIFESYDALLTEIVVRLPYLVSRALLDKAGPSEWCTKYSESMTYTLCEYMMLNLNALLRRQIRKLLLYICGSKEKFRMFRDSHSLNVHFQQVLDTCNLTTARNTVLSNQNVPILSYDALVDLTEHLRTCQEISQLRTGNWQKFCIKNEDVIPILVEIACYQLDDGVSPIILQLLQAAMCSNVYSGKQQQLQQSSQSQSHTAPSSSATTSKSRAERDKSEEIDSSYDSKFDNTLCATFVGQIFRFVSDSLLNKFVKLFLLESNITSIRWQTHSLIHAIYESCTDRQKDKLISILWNMWPLVPSFGRRTAQFVDILGYFTLSTKSVEENLTQYTEMAVEVLRQQNELLSKHPNASIYATLEQVLQVNGYYLESEPCLVCNNPEMAMTNIKLPSIKADSKFTTTTMIVKLVQSHTISKLIMRIADLKRTKMVRTINIYYNNRTVQAVVELKNRPALWHKARSINLQSGQTEVKIDFPLPITACNLMIEYADFYETVTGSSESLQCPRCSAAVPSHPGICANCGENVFQCHKCRAINYDEKDPFLCHSCGFCKYAKFDFSIFGRVCCAVDPIESAEDRAKTVQIIHSSLERADRIYRQLQTNKQMLELLIQKVAEQRCSDRLVDDHLGTVHSTSQVNKIIQLLAQKYCIESRASFEELSKIVQKVKACRSELVAYDRSQQDQSAAGAYSDSKENYTAVNRCYGCALASMEQCLTLLRAMATNPECQAGLYAQGLVDELAQHNLRRGTPQIQDEVRNLLVLLTKNNKDACSNLLELISERVKTALFSAFSIGSLDSAIHHEMVLLEVLITHDDFCWEEKLRVVFELFLITCRAPRGPAISVIQPCLRIMHSLICPHVPVTKQNRELGANELGTIKPVDGVTVDFKKWLFGDPEHSFDAWVARMPRNICTKPRRQYTLPEDHFFGTMRPTFCDLGDPAEKRKIAHENYLREKFYRRWRNRVLRCDLNTAPTLHSSWLQPILFNVNSRFSRQLACSLITSLSRTHERKREILNLLTDFLQYVGEAGEASAEFLAMYRTLATDTPWRQYLALRGVLTKITQYLTDEIAKIHQLEETTLSSDLSQGYAMRQFVELLALFLDSTTIRRTFKTRMLGPVLESYLSLRKLVVQRTRLIDDAQEKLLEMLEEMTSGTEEETRAFMVILIDTVEKTRMNDIKTPVFIFERLYSIIHPEENDESEFFMTLEKDPQQEDFLQGRMLGNPYPSSEPGLGPLMRDVKNKICTDCELIALLEDDNGMELLVNNKIISLDLPVKDVYKKIWIAEGGERDAMRIVYRMRGLLGDATEEFVETLNNKSQEEVDTEQLYRLANVLADFNGLKVMLDRIGSLQNISRTRELVQVLLKLFLICVKVRRCQEVLCQPQLGAINILLKVLQMCLQSENDSIQSSVTEQLLEIMETILSKAASDTLDSFLQFSLTFGGPEFVSALISCTECANVRNNPSVLRHLIRVLAALVYGNDLKMALLCEHFKDVLNFDKFDVERTPEEEFKMELFCVLTNQIEHNCIGGTLKDYIVSLGIVERAISYINSHAPCVKPTLLRTDSDELKEFISRPSLKYILRFLTGLANKHEPTQNAISKDIIPIIHRLEQISSDDYVGSLAENLLEALCTDAGTAARVQEVRDFTRAEKKRLAMATRERQLDALGMRTNEKGQVTAKGSILQKIEKLRDETGLTCFICREGYACQPSKVLGIYTFTKRCNVEEFELKSRKTIGYTTVTHFNVVHVDCHTSAIRLTRGRDEWERASLQNANTRCNGLLPLWGPDVSEAAFSACMTRHTSYMQESTQRCEISFATSIHDLKLLLIRFAWERSFHDDAGGGGPQSNMHFVPYLLFYSLYLLLSMRPTIRETKTLSTFVNTEPCEKWLEAGYEVEGPLYIMTLSLAFHNRETWEKHKITHLKRLIAIAQARHVSPSVQCKALLSQGDRQPKDWAVYRPFLMMWGLIDMIYKKLFKTVPCTKDDEWALGVFEYIRKNDETMLKSTDAILKTFTEEYLPCTSFAEFCDVVEILDVIENPDGFIEEVLAKLPSSSTA